MEVLKKLSLLELDFAIRYMESKNETNVLFTYASDTIGVFEKELENRIDEIYMNVRKEIQLVANAPHKMNVTDGPIWVTCDYCMGRGCERCDNNGGNFETYIKTIQNHGKVRG